MVAFFRAPGVIRALPYQAQCTIGHLVYIRNEILFVSNCFVSIKVFNLKSFLSIFDRTTTVHNFFSFESLDEMLYRKFV